MSKPNIMMDVDIFHSDAPIVSPQDDLLDRSEFVINLSKKIVQFKSKNSLVIALYGPWGSGKTSVLNMIDQILSNEKNLRVLNFDPWYFNSQEQLIQTFLYNILGEAVKAASKDQSSIKQNLDLYGISIASAFSVSPKLEIAGVGVDMGSLRPFHDLKEPSAVKEKLKKNLANRNMKFVILIDNLDRLEPAELLLMFKLVKLCADFPNFVYVLAFDHKQAEKILKKQDVDPEFLAKIVQVDIELPNIEQENVDNFIFQNLRGFAKDFKVFINDENWKRFEETYQVGVSGVLIDDLRKAKRFINSVSFSISLVKSDLDFSDFLLLEIVRIFNPQIYELLPYYRKVLTASTLNDETMALLKILRDKMSDSTDKTLETVYEKIVGALFPAFREFCLPNNKSKSVRMDYKYVIEQRICVNDFFDDYFQFKTPQDPISKSVISNMIDDLNCGTADPTYLSEFFRKMSDDRKLAFALARFQLMLRLENDCARKTLVDALIALSPCLTWEEVPNFNSSGKVASSLLQTCLDGHSSKEMLLSTFIMEASLAFVLNTTDTLVFRKKLTPDGMLDEAEDPLASAVQALNQRLRKEFIAQHKNIIAESPVEYKKLVKLWLKIFGASEFTDIQNYFYRLNSEDTRVLPTLIDIFYSSAPGEWPKKKENAVEEFKKWFDVQKMIEDYKVVLNSKIDMPAFTKRDLDMLGIVDIDVKVRKS